MSDIPTTPETPARRVPRWAKWTMIGSAAAVVLFFGAILLYAKVINDAPDEFSSDDLGDVLANADTGAPTDTAVVTTVPIATIAPTTATTGPAPTAADATPAATTVPDAIATTASTATSTPAAIGSSWVATEASEVGYRVQEVLFGVDTTAVGRTNQVTGSLTIAGTQVTSTEFTVDVASITSPESRRDEQFRDRIMSVDEFPTATFALTAPIELGVEPGEGVQVTATATGELTLRGVTRAVTFDVTALQQAGLIGVQGSIPVVFADYDIANPSFGGITTEDNGLVEFILVFQPA